MDTQNAIALSHEVADLIGLCATFQAKYGRHHQLKPGSDQEVWEVYQRIVNQQVLIAEMIDPDALERPNANLTHWWERQDILDLTIAYKLMEEVNRLIAACAYFEAEASSPENARSYTVFCTQSVIAGLLHPCTRQIALANLEKRPQKVG